MKQSSLLCHLDVDARGLGIGVSHHVLDRLDVHALLDQQSSEGMPQGVGRDLRITDPDAPKPLLDNAAYGLPDDAVVTPALVGDEQRVTLGEVAVGDIFLQPLDGVRMQDDDLVLIRAALELDVEDRLSLARREVADVDSLHLTSAQAVEQHQRDHQPVAAADHRLGVDTPQQPECLICHEGQFAVFGVSLTALNPGGDVVAVAAPLTESIEELKDGDEAVHRVDTLTFGLKLLLVLQHMGALRGAGVNIPPGQPPKPESDLPFVVQFGRREDIALRDPFGDYFVQLESSSHFFRILCSTQWLCNGFISFEIPMLISYFADILSLITLKWKEVSMSKILFTLGATGIMREACSAVDFQMR